MPPIVSTPVAMPPTVSTPVAMPPTASTPVAMAEKMEIKPEAVKRRELFENSETSFCVNVDHPEQMSCRDISAKKSTGQKNRRDEQERDKKVDTRRRKR